MNKRPEWLVFVLLIGIVLSFSFNGNKNPSVVYVATPFSVVIATQWVATITPYPTVSPVPTSSPTPIATLEPQSATETLKNFSFLECLVSLAFLVLFFGLIILIFRILLAIQ